MPTSVPAPRGTVTDADIRALYTRLRWQHGLSHEAAEDMIRTELLPNLHNDRSMAEPHTRSQFRHMPLREEAPSYERGQDQPRYGFSDTSQPSPQAAALGRVLDALQTQTIGMSLPSSRQFRAPGWSGR